MMYNSINKAIGELSSEEKISLNTDKLKFEGFEGNANFHYKYLLFLVETKGSYPQYRDMNLNSHSELSLEKYRKMLKYYHEVESQSRNYLSKEDIIKLVELV